MPLEGAVPFLIEWGETEHPAGAAPRAGELISLRIGHPNPNRLRLALDALGVRPEVHEAQRCELTATVRCARGLCEIR
jgi:hypothetical protein